MAIDPNPGPMWLPFIPELFAEAAGTVSAALRAAGQETNALLLERAKGVVARMSALRELDTARLTQVLDAADQLPELHGSAAMADLRDLVITFENQALPPEQRRPVRSLRPQESQDRATVVDLGDDA